MVEYIKSNDIQRVVCLEISRLGRNTLEALKVINYLNENGVSLYVKNYNLETLVDGKVNPVASLICTILLEIASMERLTIKERMTSGRNQYLDFYPPITDQVTGKKTRREFLQRQHNATPTYTSPTGS